MIAYYLARALENEAFAVFETVDGFLNRIYPHTKDSLNYEELNTLIDNKDSSVIFCNIEYAKSLEWKPLPPKTIDDLLKEVQEKRASEYPPMADYLDGIVKGDNVQVQTYINACLNVKSKYPKPS
jgi:hypothetical protein